MLKLKFFLAIKYIIDTTKTIDIVPYSTKKIVSVTNGSFLSISLYCKNVCSETAELFPSYPTYIINIGIDIIKAKTKGAMYLIGSFLLKIKKLRNTLIAINAETVIKAE